MYLKVVVLLIVVVLLTYVLLHKKRETFLHEADECGFFYEHTLSTDANIYLKFLVTKVLEKLNKEQDKCFEAVNLDRVAIRKDKSNPNKLHYKIHYFISEWNGNANRKLVFTLAVDEVKGSLDVFSVKDGASLDPVLPRQKEPERQSILYKPKSTIPVVGNTDETQLENSRIYFEEQCKEEMIKRNKALDVPERDFVNEDQYYPMRMKLPKWNTLGLHSIDEGITKETSCMKSGIFHGVKKEDKHVYPTYNPTLFFGNNENFDWLFSLTEDAASRPVGIA